MPTGYQEIYLKLIPRLADCDFADAAGRLGLELTQDGSLRVTFLSRQYRITKQGAEPVDGQPVDVNRQSVLLYYLLSKGCGEPKNSYAPLFRLTGMPEGRNSQKPGIMNDPLIREFGNDYEKFRFAAAKLGGTCESESTSGKYEWLFKLLPKIPAKVIFYEADAEFPAETQILLDETAPRFLEFECLAFLTGCLVSALIQTASRSADAENKAAHPPTKLK